ncbi:DUF4896 domain-containing protein [Pseudothermotoga sp.]|uniref:DUF4896 domain-containing protein n=1 Tax=Pseudothermotoga sp. TaxID=2033661 RepID=UPI000E834C82|nr:DUF4896 domain-containing protein [Pseudothermotoga sp.]MDI3495545.1 maltose/maltodextrin transport system permease protein [Pseudothermotoga sp.]HBJ81741.1 maltose ABC transporter permease [Pseudothermotoga sp.]
MKYIFRFLKWSLFLIMNVLFFWGAAFLIQNGYYELGVVFFILLFLIDFFIFNPRAYPYRYVAPALVLLFVLVLYPIYFTVKIAFTNYGTGHYMQKQEAIERLLYDPNFTYAIDDKSVDYKIFLRYDGLTPTDDFVILFKINGQIFLGEKPKAAVKRGQEVLLSEAYLYPIKEDYVEIDGKQYRITPVSNDLGEIKLISLYEKTYRAFYSPGDPFLQVNEPHFKGKIAQLYLYRSDFVDQNGVRYALRVAPDGEWRFMQIERLYRLGYEEIYEDGKVKSKAILVNNKTENKLIEREGALYDLNEKGEEVFLIGFIDYVGWKNFIRIATDPNVSGPFLKIFIWTFIWALLSVVLSLAVGLPFALILNDSRLRGRNVYRTLLIIPWAIPVFISALIWRNGLLNETYGLINKFLLPLFGLPAIKWMNDALWARIGVLIVNIWLTFPYMMTISLGALQGIPPEMYEVAMIDGAGRFKRFAYVTFPFLMTVIAPLLVSSFAFSFNNFTIIYLITGGGPPIPGSTTPTGYTDILISYVYKLAFEAGEGQNFGFAGAISIMIFFLVGGISLFNFKISGAFEEVE